MTGEDEEDVDTSVIMLYYSPYVDVLVNSHATDCRPLCHTHKLCDGATCTVKGKFGKAVFLLMFWLLQNINNTVVLVVAVCF